MTWARGSVQACVRGWCVPWLHGPLSAAASAAVNVRCGHRRQPVRLPGQPRHRAGHLAGRRRRRCRASRADSPVPMFRGSAFRVRERVLCGPREAVVDRAVRPGRGRGGAGGGRARGRRRDDDDVGAARRGRDAGLRRATSPGSPARATCAGGRRPTPAGTATGRDRAGVVRGDGGDRARPAPLRHYVARVGGEPVASASVLLAAGSGRASTRWRPRRRGGVAVSARRSPGTRWPTRAPPATTTAMLGAEPVAVNLYRRLGFRPVGEMRVYAA